MKVVIVFETTHGNELKILNALTESGVSITKMEGVISESIFIINNDQSGDPSENNNAVDDLISLANEERINE